MLFDRRAHRIDIEHEVAAQRHTDELHADEGRDHFVHHERRLWREHHSTGARHAHENNLNQLVRTVAQQHVHAGRHGERLLQLGTQCLRRRIGIPVDGHIAQDFKPLLLERRRPGVRVFHGVELDEPARVRNVIGLERTYLRADQAGDEVIIFHGKNPCVRLRCANRTYAGCAVLFSYAFHKRSIYSEKKIKDNIVNISPKADRTRTVRLKGRLAKPAIPQLTAPNMNAKYTYGAN